MMMMIIIIILIIIYLAEFLATATSLKCKMGSFGTSHFYLTPYPFPTHTATAKQLQLVQTGKMTAQRAR